MADNLNLSDTFLRKVGITADIMNLQSPKASELGSAKPTGEAADVASFRKMFLETPRTSENIILTALGGALKEEAARLVAERERDGKALVQKLRREVEQQAALSIGKTKQQNTEPQPEWLNFLSRRQRSNEFMNGVAECTATCMKLGNPEIEAAQRVTLTTELKETLKKLNNAGKEIFRPTQFRTLEHCATELQLAATKLGSGGSFSDFTKAAINLFYFVIDADYAHLGRSFTQRAPFASSKLVISEFRKVDAERLRSRAIAQPLRDPERPREPSALEFAEGFLRCNEDPLRAALINVRQANARDVFTTLEATDGIIDATQLRAILMRQPSLIATATGRLELVEITKILSHQIWSAPVIQALSSVDPIRSPQNFESLAEVKALFKQAQRLHSWTLKSAKFGEILEALPPAPKGKLEIGVISAISLLKAKEFSRPFSTAELFDAIENDLSTQLIGIAKFGIKNKDAPFVLNDLLGELTNSLGLLVGTQERGGHISRFAIAPRRESDRVLTAKIKGILDAPVAEQKPSQDAESNSPKKAPGPIIVIDSKRSAIRDRISSFIYYMGDKLGPALNDSCKTVLKPKLLELRAYEITLVGIKDLKIEEIETKPSSILLRKPTNYIISVPCYPTGLVPNSDLDLTIASKAHTLRNASIAGFGKDIKLELIDIQRYRIARSLEDRTDDLRKAVNRCIDSAYREYEFSDRRLREIFGYAQDNSPEDMRSDLKALWAQSKSFLGSLRDLVMPDVGENGADGKYRELKAHGYLNWAFVATDDGTLRAEKVWGSYQTLRRAIEEYLKKLS